MVKQPLGKAPKEQWLYVLSLVKVILQTSHALKRTGSPCSVTMFKPTARQLNAWSDFCLSGLVGSFRTKTDVKDYEVLHFKDQTFSPKVCVSNKSHVNKLG